MNNDTESEAIDKPIGLTLSFFKRFVEIHGGREAFQGLTTGDVCTKFLLPYTASTKLSLAEHVCHQPGGSFYAKPATWFVSHAWSYLYLDVVDALDDFFQEQGLDDSVALWFCTFCNNQHEIEGHIHSFQHWFQIFRSALREIGNVVMVMSPWNDPTTLKRTWCVFEVYASIVENAWFEIAMGRTQRAGFLQDMQSQDHVAFLQMLGTIQSEKSQTTMPMDRVNIFHHIHGEVGFAKLDRMVFDAIEKWMLRTVDQQIDQATSLGSKAAWLFSKGQIAEGEAQYDIAVALFQESYEKYRDEKGIMFPGTWKAFAQLAKQKMHLGGSHDDVEAMYLEALDHQTELLSRDHEDTLDTMTNLGDCYINLGKYDMALKLLLECFDHQLNLFGEDHQVTLGTMSQIGNALRHKNKPQDALQWMRRCYEIACRVFGDDHPQASVFQHNLGVLYNRIGDFGSAEMHITASCTAFERMLHSDHSGAVAFRLSLGDTYRHQGKYAEAKKTLLSCLQNENLYSRLKESCYQYLGYLYLAMGEFNHASEYLNRGLEYVTTQGNTAEKQANYLLPLFILKTKTAKFDHLDEIDSFEKAMLEINWIQDVWKNWTCHGCYQEIFGIVYSCVKCPALSLRYCRSCVDLKKQEAFCNHGRKFLEGEKPPLRYLQEQRLKIFLKNSQWAEYQQHFLAYQAYCDENHVSFDERLAQHTVGG
ncbi:hypothetical protein LEN26_010778 [Aphanomyces euteiches]|nr:hypothetical protein AeMF1_021200 [Aphanomyces euteiches]KAH9121173.1 hypothetical protein LEN26_010778 [Aphanomyces euteiches]KAH9188468.1 hypothetical protein AeNC1_009553 [Aphanomyces euteiches]